MSVCVRQLILYPTRKSKKH